MAFCGDKRFQRNSMHTRPWHAKQYRNLSGRSDRRRDEQTLEGSGRSKILRGTCRAPEQYTRDDASAVECEAQNNATQLKFERGGRIQEREEAVGEGAPRRRMTAVVMGELTGHKCKSHTTGSRTTFGTEYRFQRPSRARAPGCHLLLV